MYTLPIKAVQPSLTLTYDDNFYNVVVLNLHKIDMLHPLFDLRIHSHALSEHRVCH